MPKNATTFARLPVGSKFKNQLLGDGPIFRKVNATQAILLNSVMKNAKIRPTMLPGSVICIPAA